LQKFKLNHFYGKYARIIQNDDWSASHHWLCGRRVVFGFTAHCNAFEIRFGDARNGQKSGHDARFTVRFIRHGGRDCEGRKGLVVWQNGVGFVGVVHSVWHFLGGF
jgi:hypothetical protein